MIPLLEENGNIFLEKLGLNNFSSREIDVIDHTLGLVDDAGNLVGTGSIAGNVLKYIGVCNEGAQPGARFNKIVTALQQYIFNQKKFFIVLFLQRQSILKVFSI